MKYWEIGNEVYGNGYYGADWETDNHAEQEPDDLRARTSLQYVSAMKAVDPTHQDRRGADAARATGRTAWWRPATRRTGTTRCCPIAGSAIDFVIVHWYPSGTGAADVLTEPAQLAGELAQLRQEIDQYAGRDGPDIRRRADRDELRRRRGHPAGRAVRRGHLHDRAGAGRVHRGLVGHAQRRRPRSAPPRTAPPTTTTRGMLSSGTCVGNGLRAAAQHAVPHLLRHLDAEQPRQPGDQMVRAQPASRWSRRTPCAARTAT